MKSSRSISWSELKVGIVLITALLMLGIGILELGASSEFFRKKYNLYVHVDNTFGIKLGSVVRLSGLEVGNVSDIRFPKDFGDKKIILKLNIDADYMDRIRQDSSVTIRTLGLLGDKYLDISMGSPKFPALADGDDIRDVRDSQLNAVISGASSGIEGLNVVMGQLKDILGEVSEGNGTAGMLLRDEELYDRLKESAASIQAVTNDIKTGKGSAGRFVQDPALFDNLVDVSAKARVLVDKLNNGSIAKFSQDREFYDNLLEVSRSMKEVSASASGLIGNLQSGSIAKISSDKALYERMDRVSLRMDAVFEKLDKGQGSAGKMLMDEGLYNNMNTFFKHADDLVTDFKKNPKKYVNISIF
ncbi:MAG TPA: MlaD family protein [Nitrospirota bacterium]|jgi:phospholipid/cholesterol/gamma-HCH transport system substrate-binding protein